MRAAADTSPSKSRSERDTGFEPAPQVTSNEHTRLSESLRGDSSSETPPIDVDAKAIGPGSGPVDAVESALADALVRATAEGRLDVVAQLARELEARRLARGNVVMLDAARDRSKGRR